MPFMYCGAWGEEKFDVSSGLCWVSHQVFFFKFLHVSQTTDCKGGPGSRSTFHLRTEMSLCSDVVLFILKGSYSNHGHDKDAQKIFHGFSQSFLGSDGQVSHKLFFYNIPNLYPLVIVMLIIPVHLSYQYPYH